MEHVRQIIAWELFFIIIFTALIVVSQVDSSGFSVITGRVVQANLPQTDLLSDIEESIPNFEIFDQAGDFSSCLIVNLDDAKYSFEIVKVAGIVAVLPSDDPFCRGNEDLVISYVSYEALKEHLDNPPSFNEFRRTMDGANFYIYPSKLIGSGLKILDYSNFNLKFGDIIRANLPASEARLILEPPRTEEPTSFISIIFYIVIGLVILIVVISIILTRFAKKPEVKTDLELVAGIKSYLAQGYTVEQLRQHLLSNGWKLEQIDSAIKKAQEDVSMPDSFV